MEITNAALPRSPERPSPGIAIAVEKPLRRPGDGPPHLVDGLDVGPLPQVGVLHCVGTTKILVLR